jgi:hypothetical protein
MEHSTNTFRISSLGQAAKLFQEKQVDLKKQPLYGAVNPAMNDNLPEVAGEQKQSVGRRKAEILADFGSNSQAVSSGSPLKPIFEALAKIKGDATIIHNPGDISSQTLIPLLQEFAEKQDSHFIHVQFSDEILNSFLGPEHVLKKQIRQKLSDSPRDKNVIYIEPTDQQGEEYLQRQANYIINNHKTTELARWLRDVLEYDGKRGSTILVLPLKDGQTSENSGTHLEFIKQGDSISLKPQGS